MIYMSKLILIKKKSNQNLFCMIVIMQNVLNTQTDLEYLRKNVGKPHQNRTWYSIAVINTLATPEKLEVRCQPLNFLSLLIEPLVPYSLSETERRLTFRMSRPIHVHAWLSHGSWISFVCSFCLLKSLVYLQILLFRDIFYMLIFCSMTSVTTILTWFGIRQVMPNPLIEASATYQISSHSYVTS